MLLIQVTLFFAHHVSNTVPLTGALPYDKAEIINELDRAIKELPEEKLKTYRNRIWHLCGWESKGTTNKKMPAVWICSAGKCLFAPRKTAGAMAKLFFVCSSLVFAFADKTRAIALQQQLQIVDLMGDFFADVGVLNVHSVGAHFHHLCG